MENDPNRAAKQYQPSDHVNEPTKEISNVIEEVADDVDDFVDGVQPTYDARSFRRRHASHLPVNLYIAGLFVHPT